MISCLQPYQTFTLRHGCAEPEKASKVCDIHETVAIGECVDKKMADDDEDLESDFDETTAIDDDEGKGAS